MQKMKNGKKVLSVCLSLAMAAGMLSTSAFASWNVYGGSNNHNAVVTEAPTATDASGLDSYIQLHCTGSGWDGVDNVPVLQTVNGTTYAYVLYDGYGASGALVAKVRCAENGGSSIVWTTDPYGTEGTSLNAKSGFQLSTPYLDDKGTPTTRRTIPSMWVPSASMTTTRAVSGLPVPAARLWLLPAWIRTNPL